MLLQVNSSVKRERTIKTLKERNSLKKAMIAAVIVLAGCSDSSGAEEEAVSRPAEEQTAEQMMIDAPHISQKPELMRGCEVTTLAMLLQDAGVSVDKMTLSEEIKRVPFEENGVRGNIHEGFVGNMKTMDEPGLGVYHEPVAELAENYLPGKIKDMTGESFDSVLAQVEDGRPVWVIVTSTFDKLSESEWETWETESGPVKVTYSMHSVLVTGFDEQNLYVNDPLDKKNRKLPREEFIAGWEQIGKQAITYEKAAD